MGRSVRFNGEKYPIYVNSLYDLSDLIRIRIGDEAADYLRDEAYNWEWDKRQQEKDYDCACQELDSMTEEVNNLELELNDLEDQLKGAEDCLTWIATHIVTMMKQEEQIDLSGIVSRICQHKNKQEEDFDKSEVMPF